MYNELYHHGILGQKWGVRRFQNSDGTRTAAGKKRYANSMIDGADTYNISDWGRDADHNILYITGLSGSGKSTAALKLKNSNTNVILLDFYFEKGSKEEFDQYSDKDLNNFLDKKGIHMERLWDGSLNKQQRWKLIDSFTEATEEFGRKQYIRGKRVVMEGVQLADQTMYPVKADLKGKPLAVMKTGRLTSLRRGLERDDIMLYDIPTIVKRYKDQQFWSKSLNELKKEVDPSVRNGKAAIEKYLSK